MQPFIYFPFSYISKFCSNLSNESYFIKNMIIVTDLSDYWYFVPILWPAPHPLLPLPSPPVYDDKANIREYHPQPRSQGFSLLNWVVGQREKLWEQGCTTPGGAEQMIIN